MTTKISGFALLIALLALAMPSSSRADTFTTTFLDSTDSVAWTFADNGTIVAGPFTCPPEGTACSASNIFTGAAFTPASLAFNIFDSPGGALSDTLLITVSAGSVISSFISNVDGVALTPLASATSLVEDGTVQTAATLPIGGAFPGSNLVIKFQSDVESSSTAVPEPSSIALLGAGLLGIMGLGLRMRKAQLV